jgi:excisionase family DNA binding protein
MKQKLKQAELEAALNNLPPVMTPIEAAMLLRLKLSTLYRHVSEGKYSSAVKRGKPLRFWRDRLVQEFML